jgi:uncharacterized membrane protein YqjE
VPRQTADLIALVLAATVAGVTIATAIVTLYVIVVHPEQDVVRLLDAIGRVIGVLTGALVGYMAGRRV